MSCQDDLRLSIGIFCAVRQQYRTGLLILLQVGDLFVKCESMTEEQRKNNRTNFDLTAVSQNILPLVKKVLGRKGMVGFDILVNWEKIVGPELASYCFPEKIEFKNNQRSNGVLLLSVPAGAFALELKHREKYVLEKINTFLGYAAVASLRIVQTSEMQPFEKPAKKNYVARPPVVTVEEADYIRETAEDIKNKELKEILIKLGYSVFSENKKA